MHRKMMRWPSKTMNSTTSCKRNDMIVVMGDLNAKVGNNNTNREELMGKFGVGVVNDNGEGLFDFCSANGFIITGTIFPHKDIRKLTLRSPDDPEKEHDMILATHRDAAKKVLGRSKKLSRPWIGSKMWEKIKERKEAKFKLEGSRSERLKQRWREEYNAKNNEVKRSAREDKRNWL